MAADVLLEALAPEKPSGRRARDGAGVGRAAASMWVVANLGWAWSGGWGSGSPGGGSPAGESPAGSREPIVESSINRHVGSSMGSKMLLRNDVVFGEVNVSVKASFFLELAFLFLWPWQDFGKMQ